MILYFWSDVSKAVIGLGRLLRGKVDTQWAFLALCLVISTIPVVIAGLIIKVTGLDEAMRSVAVIGWTMLISASCSTGAGKKKSDRPPDPHRHAMDDEACAHHGSSGRFSP